MTINGLTDKEKQVLYGLVRYPLLNNRALSELLGLNHSTVTVIHRKLKNTGAVQTVRIPLLQNLGCEMLAVTYSAFSSSVPLKERLEISANIAERYDEVFWAVSDKTQGVSLQLSRNYTDAKEKVEELGRAYCKQNVVREPNIALLAFPFKLIRQLNFFDYAPLLEQVFGQSVGEQEEVPTEMAEPSNKEERGEAKTHFTETEKIIFYALIKHPQLSDKELEEIIVASRHTIARARKKFEKEGFTKTIRIVNMEKLGFTILGLHHYILDMKTSEERIEEGIEAINSNRQPIFMVRGNTEGVMIVPYTSFEDLRACSEKVADINKEYDMFTKDPIGLFFFIGAMENINDHDYAPIVEKMLGMQRTNERVRGMLQTELSRKFGDILSHEMGTAGIYLLKKQCKTFGIEIDRIKARDIPKLSKALMGSIVVFTGEAKAHDIYEEVKALLDVGELMREEKDVERKIEMRINTGDTDMIIGEREAAMEHYSRALELSQRS
ncbi:MAG: MarR family transcriptional regulator, partial [Thermoplasmata archaeon]|nr:MarR family transcriptional regulator [Thermoplasmata archaeon]